MANHNQDPSLLSKKYSRRAKVAAGLAGLGIPAFAGGYAAKSAEAASARAESLSPSSYLKQEHSKLMKLKEEVLSAPGVKKIKGAPSRNFSQTKTVPTEVYYIMAKDKANPKHHDVLGVQVAKGEELPLAVVMTVDLESYQKYLATKDQASSQSGARGAYYDLNPIGGHGEFTASELTLLVQDANNDDSAVYRVGAKPAWNPAEVTSDYLDKPSLVAKQFNAFFTRAENILKAPK